MGQRQSGTGSPIGVSPDVLEKLANSLDVARVPVRLERVEPTRGINAFLPLEPRHVGPLGKLSDLHPGVPVKLHIYDIEVYSLESTWISKVSGVPIYHLGVEVYNVEFCYGLDGITTIWPGTYDEKRHRCELEVGRTRLTNRQVLSMLSDMSDEWSGQKYRLVGYNCQTFAIAFCKALGLGDTAIPPEYFRFADSWTKPKEAPAQDADGEATRIRL